MIWRIAGICLVLALLMRPSYADDRKDIESLYLRLAAALQKYDANALLALETPDFRHKNRAGKVRRAAQIAAEMRAQAKRLPPGKMTIRIVGGGINGRSCTTEVMYSFETDTRGADGVNHKTILISGGRNILTKTHLGWRITFMEEIGSVHTVRDGKLANNLQAPKQDTASK